MSYQTNYTLPTELMEEIMAHGLEALPEMLRIMLNLAMQIERQQYLGVGPYERSAERQGQWVQTQDPQDPSGPNHG